MISDLRLLENTRRYRKTKKGLITNLFHKLKQRNTVDFDLTWLHEFSKSVKFNRLYIEWEKSGYKKEFKPSLDRINNKKGYLKNNIQWLTWSENRHKQIMERRSRKGPVIQMQGDKVIKIYKSQRDAVIATGISQSCISSCLNRHRQTAGGYSWVYENPELLEDK